VGERVLRGHGRARVRRRSLGLRAMLDSLMEPKAVIAEAQAKAAKAFGARRTFFATNGTSTANKVIFQTLLAPGEKLILDRNCHKSVHHGGVLSGAHPIYVDSALTRNSRLY